MGCDPSFATGRLEILIITLPIRCNIRVFMGVDTCESKVYDTTLTNLISQEF